MGGWGKYPTNNKIYYEIFFYVVNVLYLDHLSLKFYWFITMYSRTFFFSIFQLSSGEYYGHVFLKFIKIYSELAERECSIIKQREK